MRCIHGSSPRGSSNGGGDRSRARDTSRLAPTFSDIEDELQRSIDDEIRLRRDSATLRRVTLCWLCVAGSRMERRQARATVRVSIFADQNSS
jgi:hypothetical protein